MFPNAQSNPLSSGMLRTLVFDNETRKWSSYLLRFQKAPFPCCRAVNDITFSQQTPSFLRFIAFTALLQISISISICSASNCKFKVLWKIANLWMILLAVFCRLFLQCTDPTRVKPLPESNIIQRLGGYLLFDGPPATTRVSQNRDGFVVEVVLSSTGARLSLALSTN